MEVLRSSGLDEMRQRHYRDSVVRSIEYVAVMDTRWASVVIIMTETSSCWKYLPC